ncbi:MAG: polyprenyl synthetase family protein [Flavobacteriales bacterium]
MQEILPYKQYIEKAIAELAYEKEPKELYEPIRYTLDLGGKRMRPILLLLACEMFNGNKEDALQQALAIEVFHNFTLLHDDIMDQAPLRRNKPTVFKKWNENIAILSGDVMFVESCQLMIANSGEKVHQIMKVFFEAAIEVCEGQQWDMNFENANDVSVNAYLHMIELKTAALLGGALQIGALMGDATIEQSNWIKHFGRNIGVAFQLMDDVLDCYGDPALVGKQTGGDIKANKKTYLLIRTIEKASPEDHAKLTELMQPMHYNEQKVREVMNLYARYGVKEEAELIMQQYFNQAIEQLEKIGRDDNRAKQIIRNFAESLMKRSY